LHRNCLLKHVIEGVVEEMGRRGRRHEKLLYDLNKTKKCWKLKEEALDHNLCGT
jgi:hypothetical protein